MLSLINRHKVLFMLFVFYILYAGFLIWRSSFIVEGVRYFTLFDDEMISMRYARNLAEGFGLVWNPGGERVEGITNPLWTLFMAVIHLFPLSPNLMSLPIQIVGLICMVITGIYVKQIVELLVKNKQVALLAVFLTLFYYPLNNWNVVLGTEVSILILLITIATYFILKAEKEKRFSYVPFILLAIATGVRLDAFVPGIILLSYSWLRLYKQYRRELLLASGIMAGAVALQEVLRFWYYHDFFPNTYYLKMTGYAAVLRMARGVYVLKDTLNWLLLLIPLVILLIKRDSKLLLLLSLFLGQVFYSVYVGGDAWEHFGGSNRYITLGMPSLFILLTVSLFQLWQLITASLSVKSVKRLRLIPFAVVGILFLSLHLKNDTMLLSLFQLRPPQTVGENKQQVTMANLLNKVSSESATVGVVWAGIIPYYTEREYIDLLGKNDRHIGHMQAHDLGVGQEGLKRYVTFYPGHMKWDTKYIASKKPDIFIQVYPQEEAKQILPKDYDQYFDSQGFLLTIRKDTQKVNRLDLRKVPFL